MRTTHPDDPLVRDFHATLAAYEQLLTEKNGRNQTAGRTRQKIKNKGIVQSLSDWASSSAETPASSFSLKLGCPSSRASTSSYGTQIDFRPRLLRRRGHVLMHSG